MSQEAILGMMRAVIGALDGAVSLSAVDVQTGRRIEISPNRSVGTASVIKLPILVATLQKSRDEGLSLDQPLTLTDDDKVIGSGVLQHLSEGLKLPLRDALLLMIILSDNTATNLVIDSVGLAELNHRFRTLGLKRTTLLKYVFKSANPPTADSEKFGLGVTSPSEMSELLARLHRRQLLGEAHDSIALDILGKQEYRTGIPRLLPADWKFMGKSGSVDTMRNDVGLLELPDGRAFAIAVFCQNLRRTTWSPDTPAQLAIGRLAELACAYLVG